MAANTLPASRNSDGLTPAQGSFDLYKVKRRTWKRKQVLQAADKILPQQEIIFQHQGPLPSFANNSFCGSDMAEEATDFAGRKRLEERRRTPRRKPRKLLLAKDSAIGSLMPLESKADASQLCRGLLPSGC